MPDDPSQYVRRNADRYGVDAWGAPYVRFSGAGHAAVTPDADTPAIDLYELVEHLRARRMETPLLLRFPQIMTDRARRIIAAFERARQGEGYGGRFRCIYPIKVNQQGGLLEHAREELVPLGVGFEAGSKPELLTVLGLTTQQTDTPIVCNGYKDDEYLRLVIDAHRLGRPIVPVLESARELRAFLANVPSPDLCPTIGLRAKLAARGAGRWEDSGGMRSKFGLFLSELVEAIDVLRARELLGRFSFLHFHLGSQMSDIGVIRDAARELAHLYTELRALGAPIDTVDVGGGLAVDYEGTRSGSHSSGNYDLGDYARTIVEEMRAMCDERGHPHPTIFTECGRALSAHSSVLVFDVVGVARYGEGQHETIDDAEDRGALDEECVETIARLESIDATRVMEDPLDAYGVIASARDRVLELFAEGRLPLRTRARAERLFWTAGRMILEELREDLESGGVGERIAQTLADQYLCNISVFQSLPDSWAVQQLFPICPIHRLDEPPTRRATLVDLTCDSDGKIERFPHPTGPRRTLPLHTLRRGEAYYLGVFLVGAYQEILGDYHNLFGDTNLAHVHVAPDGSYEIARAFPAETNADVMQAVMIDSAEILDRLCIEADDAAASGLVSADMSRTLKRTFRTLMQSPTYLRREAEPRGGEPA